MHRRLARFAIRGCLFVLVASTLGSSGVVAASPDGRPDPSHATERPVQKIAAGSSPTVTAISGGWGHTCALLADNTVRCWGDNFDGQLGDGTTTDRPIPVRVSGISTATAISAGGDHTCALLADHTVRCWGDNFDGQLGDGTTLDRHTPVTVSGISTAVGIAASDGWGHTCALLAEGTVRCWGNNTIGQLGDHTWSSKNVPVAVVEIAVHHPSVGLLEGVASIAVGGNLTCAVLTTRGVACWGNNGYGQLGGLGHDTWTSSNTPVTVGGINTATGAAAGLDHACAVLADASVRCWGGNTTGQLGDGTSDPDRHQASVAVSGIGTATAIAARSRHTCARLEDGTVRCWGSNGSGELGDGTTTQRSAPVAVTGIGTASKISTGSSHSCALLTDGTVRCWGRNDSGQLGDASTTERHTPVAVVFPPSTPFTDIAGSPFKPDIEWVYTAGITYRLHRHRLLPRGLRHQRADGELPRASPQAHRHRPRRLHRRRDQSPRAQHQPRRQGRHRHRLCPGQVLSDRPRVPGADGLVPRPCPQARRHRPRRLHRRRAAASTSPTSTSSPRQGVATGCGNGKYCPTANVTRGQMAAFLHRAFGP